MTEAHNPTPSEMMTLLHWWLMVWNGAVLACDGLEKVEWWAVPAVQWHQRYDPSLTHFTPRRRPILTKNQLWPPCDRCGSDGWPADHGAGEDDYTCYDCNPEYIREVLGHRPRLLERQLRHHDDSRNEILSFRIDPTCYSYRGLGRVVDNTPS